MKDPFINIALGVLIFAVVLLGGVLFYVLNLQRQSIELIDAEPGVRCAIATAPGGVAINCWRIDE